jgi:hypothetical protein
MKIFKIIVFALLLFVLAACVYVPVSNHDAESATCKTFSNSMSLDTKPFNGNVECPAGADVGGCLAAIALLPVFLPVGTLIISGTIVVSNNTIHWLEYQGTCSDGYLNNTKKMFLNSMSAQKVEH